MSKQNKKIITLLKKGWFLLAAVIITMAILFSLFRALTPWARQYKGEVENQLSLMLGHPVHIKNMETSWYWFEPVLKLDKITIVDERLHILKLDKLLVGINLFSSLWHWQIQPGILYIDDVHLNVQQVDNRWQIDGLGLGKQIVEFKPEAYTRLLGWLLVQQKIVLNNVSALVHLKDGTLLPINNLNLTAINNADHYSISGSADLAQTTATRLVMLGDLHIEPSALNKTRGEVYLSVSNLLPAQWQNFLPESNYRLEGGHGNIQLWLDVAKGQVDLVQSQFDFNHIALREEEKNKHYFLQSINANLAWKPTESGWQVAGDDIRLQVAGKPWPENKLLINYNRLHHAYQIYLKEIDLAPIFEADIDWPESIKPLVSARPVGQLHDTQFMFKDQKIGYFLTRFASLGLKGNAQFPMVKELSGGISWQPDQGRLELDALNSILQPNNKPAVHFDQINGAIDWKTLSHGLRVTMERMVVTGSDFVVSAQGKFEDALTSPFITMETTFSAEKVEQWLDYIPHGYLKEKLERWLKEDIKKIGKASGRMNINGLWADFPFDKAKEGEFSISAYLNEVDLHFNKQWPLTKNIDAYLQVNKRTLLADVALADLSGVNIDSANLRIDDIGYDQETLLIHTKSQVSAPHLRSLLLVSPLKSRLTKLNMIDISGLLDVGLRMEIPLTADNQGIKAYGKLNFLKNNTVFHHAMRNIEMKAVTGKLVFDEHGITDSALKGLLMDNPVTMQIRSVHDPEKYTEVSVEGHTTVDLLQEKMNLPLLSLLKGELDIESRLKITDDPDDMDHLKLTSSLEGLEMDLPAPLGKASKTKTPLIAEVDFNPEKAIHAKFNYAGKLSADLWFERNNKALTLHRGEIRLGSGTAMEAKQAGVHLIGTLPDFNAQAWYDRYSRIATEQSNSNFAQHINYVDLELESVTAWGNTYKNLIFKANKSHRDEWSLSFKQPNFTANLFYQQAKNTLSGHFDFLHLPKSKKNETSAKQSKIKIIPNKIPNLNLTIDNFKMGDLSLGNIILKSKSSNDRWKLDYCKILSPFYQITLKGDWVERHKHSRTNLNADVTILDLAKSLKQWDISPAVEAKQGDIKFRGGWNGPVYDFSLKKLKGDLFILFKNGRITNLSPETEEKLGLGKLLSILSLQTIPRRLTLDFSDLANDGYSFDIFKGNFALKKGSMNTTDSYIDGPVAHASIKGSLDIVKRHYNLFLNVSPHITASLPIVATIAGGPIAGIATWVASKIINQGMQKISGYTYKITGPWVDPVVQQVKIIKKENRRM